MPVAAVRNAGRPTVSSGSQIAALGSRNGLKITVLRFVAPIVMTVERPTSLPVPDVVAIAINGGKFAVIFAHPSTRSSYSASGSVCVALSRIALAASSADPPPSPITPSHPEAW